jgi:capsular polysaccharide biosynthesis protein
MNQMVASLNSSLDIIRRRWIAVIASFVVGLLAIYVLFQYLPRVYEAAAQVLIVNESDGRDPSVSSVDLPALATSTVVLQRVLDELKIPVTLIELKKSLKAGVSQHSSIMQISYRDESPDRAVAVPNAVADQLSRYYATLATSRAESDVKKIDGEISVARRRLHSLDAQVAAATARDPFVGSDKSLDALTSRIDDLQTERQLAAATLAADSAAVGAVGPDSAAMSQIARHEILQGDEYHQSLLAGTSKDAANLAFDRAQYTDDYPGLRELRHKVASERSILSTEETAQLHSSSAFSPTRAQSELEQQKAQAVVAGDQAKVAALDSLIATTESRLQDLPQATRTLTWLRLQHDAAQADYLALSTRRTSAVANRAESLSLGSVVVFDRAVRADTEIVGLSRSGLAVFTASIVLLISIGMAFLIEALDPKLRRAAQIESLYGSPVIVTLGHKP